MESKAVWWSIAALVFIFSLLFYATVAAGMGIENVPEQEKDAIFLMISIASVRHGRNVANAVAGRPHWKGE